MNFPHTFNLTNYPFNKEEIGYIKSDLFAKNNYPIVYIIYDPNSRIAYVGESTNALNRMASHLSHPEKKKLKSVYIISSEVFNKSAALDIESNLIEYLSADDRFKLLNGNSGVTKHNYYQKPEYFKMFRDIWGRLKFGNVKMKNLLELENSDLFKYSPFKTLTEDQYNSIIEILSAFASGNYSSLFVNGSAGTGKTILAIYLIKLLVTFTKYDLNDLDIEDEVLLAKLNLLKRIYQDNISIGFVVPMASLRETLKKVFQSIHGLKGTMVIGPSDVIKKQYDLLIVDEAHRLTRRKGIMTYGSFDNVNRSLGLYHTEQINGKEIRAANKNGTQLDWILKSSKYQLFFYDAEQSIKPADVEKKDFDKIKALPSSKELHLVSQLRALGGNDYLKHVDQLLNCTFKSPVLFDNPNYEVILFDDMKDMMKELRLKEEEFGLCRTISGYSWEWVSKNNNKPDTTIDGVDLTWNRETKNWIHSTNNVSEMGCIHTTQGYDLNYAAIIFGEEITYNSATNSIEIIKDNYYDKNGKNGISDINILKAYIIKIYKTMLFRGIRGTYIYVCDKGLKSYFKNHIKMYVKG